MKGDFEIPRNESGRFYHIDCGEDDLAPFILTTGDPERARALAALFDSTCVERENREFLTITGEYRGIPVSAMATGIGADNTAIAVIEASQCVEAPAFIRLGSCGAMQPEIRPGDGVITERAIRDEGTTGYYAPPDLEPAADPGIRECLETACDELSLARHTGITCTTADFYAGQGRLAPGFPCLEPEKAVRLRREGVLNVEMEMACYLTLAQVSEYPLRAGGMCIAFDNMATGELGDGATCAAAVGKMLRAGLRAVEILAEAER